MSDDWIKLLEDSKKIKEEQSEKTSKILNNLNISESLSPHKSIRSPKSANYNGLKKVKNGFIWVCVFLYLYDILIIPPQLVILFDTIGVSAGAKGQPFLLAADSFEWLIPRHTWHSWPHLLLLLVLC